MTINRQVRVFSDILESAPKDKDGWIRIDKNRVAKQMGVGRVKLARVMAKAERDLGIQVDGDRVRFQTDAEIYQNRPKPDISAIITFATEFMRRIEGEKSQQD